jgi:hypothetical protein
MAKSWKALATQYLKTGHGSRASLKKASAAWHGGGTRKRRNPSGTDNLLNMALLGAAAYAGYKFVYVPWKAKQPVAVAGT